MKTLMQEVPFTMYKMHNESLRHPSSTLQLQSHVHFNASGFLSHFIKIASLNEFLMSTNYELIPDLFCGLFDIHHSTKERHRLFLVICYVFVLIKFVIIIIDINVAINLFGSGELKSTH